MIISFVPSFKSDWWLVIGGWFLNLNLNLKWLVIGGWFLNLNLNLK